MTTERYEVRSWGRHKAQAFDTLGQVYVCAPVSVTEARAVAEGLNRLAALSRAQRGSIRELHVDRRPRLWLVGKGDVDSGTGGAA